RGSSAEQTERDAACRARAGRVHERVGLATVRAEHERDASALVFEAAEVGWAQALLRAIDRCRAARAEERIVHVARDAQRRERGWDQARDASELRPRRGHGRVEAFPGAGEKLQSECGERAEAEVVGRAATDAEHNGARVKFFGREVDELAGAERG